MTHSQPPITGTTHTLPFDRLSPRDFERLCLWLVEREEPALSLSKGYERAEHLGAAGSEQGRDIVAWCWRQSNRGCHRTDGNHQEGRLMEFLHPANAEEVANIAEETGAEVLRGPLRYPSETGGWQLDGRGDTERRERIGDDRAVLWISNN